jgi:beta,beta-carotene 9',10'-dioxygenase
MSTITLRARIDAPAQTRAETDSAVRALAKRVPFRGPDTSRGTEQARLSGQLPEWLRGDLVRVAPSLGATPRWAAAHWFDALGVVFGFNLRADRVDLRWAVLDGEMSAAAQRGKVPLSSFGSPNERGAIATLLHPIPNQTDNTNVNVVRMGRDLVALTETAKQHVLDPATLQVKGRVRYEDSLGDPGMLAHPITIGDTFSNLAIRFGRRGEVVLFDHPQQSRTRQVRGKWVTDEVPYIHSFGLTRDHGIILDHPLRVRPSQLLWSNRGLIQHFEWNPNRAARLILVNRANGKITEHETEPFFCFHTVHAFETPEATVLDLAAYDDAQVVRALMVDRLVAGFPSLQTKLLRLSVDKSTGRVTRRTLSEHAVEFPQVDWERAGDNAERIVFGTSLAPDGTRIASTVMRLDLETGEARRFTDGQYVFGEPLFVGAPDRQTEGEGVLLAVGSSERGAALFVLDATTLDVLARAEVSTHLPLGFHGTFAPARA